MYKNEQYISMVNTCTDANPIIPLCRMENIITIHTEYAHVYGIHIYLSISMS